MNAAFIVTARIQPFSSTAIKQVAHYWESPLGRLSDETEVAEFTKCSCGKMEATGSGGHSHIPLPERAQARAPARGTKKTRIPHLKRNDKNLPHLILPLPALFQEPVHSVITLRLETLKSVQQRCCIVRRCTKAFFHAPASRFHLASVF